MRAIDPFVNNKTPFTAGIVIRLLGRVPSKKNARRIFANHGHVISLPSEGYERYKHESLKVIEELGITTIAPPYTITIDFMLKGKGNSDIDNMTSSIFDILQDAMVLDDDKNVLELIAHKHIGCEGYETIIRIATMIDHVRLVDEEILKLRPMELPHHLAYVVDESKFRPTKKYMDEVKKMMKFSK